MGYDYAFEATVMTDTVCLAFGSACAENVGFLAMGDSWRYYNLLGLAPKSESTGPVFIQALEQQGVISGQRATLHYNPISSAV